MVFDVGKALWGTKKGREGEGRACLKMGLEILFDDSLSTCSFLLPISALGYWYEYGNFDEGGEKFNRYLIFAF
jgi:hypothetical protein